MLAFHSDPGLKDFLIADLEAHKLADTLTKRLYWQDGKGCAVGCSLEAVRRRPGKGKKSRSKINHSDHSAYEVYLGIPRILARLEDLMFEELENGHSKEWPLRFTRAIRPGANLTMVWPRFALWLLTEFIPPIAKADKTKNVETA